jgi:hypothetical protein
MTPEEYMNSVFGDNADDVCEQLRKAMREPFAFINIYGSGSNGKSTFVELMKKADWDHSWDIGHLCGDPSQYYMHLSLNAGGSMSEFKTTQGHLASHHLVSTNHHIFVERIGSERKYHNEIHFPNTFVSSPNPDLPDPSKLLSYILGYTSDD